MDIIYDSFIGSGTIAKIAHLLKRNWIGSEISKDYCNIANIRLKKYLMDAQQLSSQTAVNGFKNEDDIVRKFNNWEKI